MSTQQNSWQKNMELWQQFGEQSMENAFALMEKNLEQSQAIQNQMQQAVEKAVENQFAMVMQGLETVEEQMKELTLSWNQLATVWTANGNAGKSTRKAAK